MMNVPIKQSTKTAATKYALIWNAERSVPSLNLLMYTRHCVEKKFPIFSPARISACALTCAFGDVLIASKVTTGCASPIVAPTKKIATKDKLNVVATTPRINPASNIP